MPAQNGPGYRVWAAGSADYFPFWLTVQPLHSVQDLNTGGIRSAGLGYFLTYSISHPTGTNPDLYSLYGFYFRQASFLPFEFGDGGDFDFWSEGGQII
jgi:hypothetical protein